MNILITYAASEATLNDSIRMATSGGRFAWISTLIISG